MTVPTTTAATTLGHNPKKTYTMKASDYRSRIQKDVKQNDHLPEIPMYNQLTKQLWDALQGDTVWAIMQRLGIDKKDDSQYKAYREGNNLKVTQKVTPHLYKLFYGVKERLHFEHDVDFFVVSSSEVNAFANIIPPSDPNSPYTVVVYSALIDMMTEAELCSVIGHELGHLLDENLALSQIFSFVFPNGEIPIPLQYKYIFWSQLSELYADRYGYLATGDINACISAEFKLKSGLKLDKMDVDMNSFIEYNREVLQHYITGAGRSIDNMTHPVSPIRVEALNLFANAKTEKELNGGMDQLVSIIARMNINNNLGKSYLNFVASAGLLLAEADDEITNEEVDLILNRMSSFHMFPKDVLLAISKEDHREVFNKSVQEILSEQPDCRNDLFMYMVDLMVADRTFHKAEIDLLAEVAQKVFQLDQETFLRLLAIGIQRGFLPSTESIS